MKTASSEHVVYINCSECQNKNKKYNLCTQHVLNLQFSFTELVSPWTIVCHIVGQLMQEKELLTKIYLYKIIFIWTAYTCKYFRNMYFFTISKHKSRKKYISQSNVKQKQFKKRDRLRSYHPAKILKIGIFPLTLLFCALDFCREIWFEKSGLRNLV